MTTRASAVRMTRPESGSATPANTRNSVDLPSPLRPTTPTRWPRSMPRVTPARTARVANTTWMSSRATTGGMGPKASRPGR